MWSAVFDSDKGQSASKKRSSDVSKVTTPRLSAHRAAFDVDVVRFEIVLRRGL
jgi:hypothetical protein